MTRDELFLLIEGRDAARSGRGARLRETAGLSQGELGRLVGVSAAAVCRWEAAERRPTGRLAIAYARALRAVARGLAALEDFEPAADGLEVKTAVGATDDACSPV